MLNEPDHDGPKTETTVQLAAIWQTAGDAGQSAVEYLASVVEFDAWDKLDKDWTSNVALRNMTPENVRVVLFMLRFLLPLYSGAPLCDSSCFTLPL